MDINRRKALLRVAFDIAAIACVAIPVLVLFALAKGYKRGFYCDDESLMHPYKANTIPTWVAGFVGIALPSLTILILEGFKAYRSEKKMFTYFAICYKLLMPFCFGCGLTQLTTDIAKYTVGRLRPHFITVCQPNIASCTVDTGFLSGDVCTGTDEAAIAEARLSFPSGHTSVAFYCMIWLIVYLQFKFTWKRYWLIRPLMQAGAFFLAYYTGLSRISDYMHHWSDVLAGAIIGTVVALLDVFFMSDIQTWRKRKCQECSSSLPLYEQNNTNGTGTSVEP
ncbi:putative phosphatidate phosphatase [Mercenaria mercenaria]|uniref:putative phosphatidate phosphatase n=1 Tax=Mercenaria mercenaria TaxID=6596 RepID=UPI001E1D93E5|nr:putative phosphatidate phosphatase [Mercenaria mercenaria]